jgi:DNA-binding IclR family transcriptional regulator
VVLAYLDDDEIERAVAAQDPSPVQGLLPDAEDIRQALASIRKQGYAITHSHRTPNTVGVGAPFFDAGGEVLGSLGFLIPSFRWEHAAVDEVVGALREAAAALSSQLGHAGGAARRA